MSRYAKVTPIEDLLDLEEDNSMQASATFSGHTPDTQISNKYIRKSDIGSYMNSVNAGSESHDTLRNYNMDFQEQPRGYRHYEIEPPRQPQHQMMAAPYRLSCSEVYDHITSCPICSKLYNQDKTIYILIIVILSLIVIVLLKNLVRK